MISSERIGSLLGKVEKDGECWRWLGTKNPKGYGRIKVAGRLEQAHRVFYEYFVGPIPDGLQLDHLCRKRDCVRPDHLEAVTCKQNIQRGLTGTNPNSWGNRWKTRPRNTTAP